MADDRIDIEVTDKVSTAPEKKLRAIGDAAGDAHKYVEMLKADLASMNVAGLIKLQTQANSTTRSITQQMNATARLTAATAKQTIADAKAATEQQRLATETARTEAATARAAAASSNAATASLRAAAAAQRAADGTGSYASRADRLKSALDPAYAAQSRFNTEVAEARTLLNAGAINMRTYTAAVSAADAKLDATKAAQDAFNNSVRQGGRDVRLAGHENANLLAQLNDVGVSLASGQNPIVVLIQQGSQLADLAGRVEGGWNTLIRSTLRLLAPFAAAAAVVGVLTAKFVMFKNELDDTSGLDEYVKTLGLTKDELKELEDVGVTSMDVLKGAWMTFKEGLPIDDVLSGISDAFKATVDFIWNGLKAFSFATTALFKGTYKTIVTIWSNFGPFISDVFYSAANGAITGIEWLVNKTIQGINWVAQQANAILGKVGLEPFGQLAEVQLGRFENKAKGTAKRVGAEIVDNYVGAYKEAEDGFNSFVDRTSANAKKAAQDRLKGQAQKLIDDRPEKKDPAGRTPREDKTEENRALALLKVNTELDNEISRMKMLKDERAIQQRFDQIEEQLLSKKIKLNEGEAASIRKKIEAIEADKYVQTERDRIMEDVLGPQRAMNANVDAATQLFEAGKISMEKWNTELERSTRLYEEATDPLFAMKEANGALERTMGFYGEALERANDLEAIRSAYLAKNQSMIDATTGNLKEEVVAQLAKNAALREEQLIKSQVSALVDPMLQRENMLAKESTYYAELQRLRDTDYLNEQQYQQAKYGLDAKFQAMRLEGASTFFGELAGLQSSSSKELAAIGKAAAIVDVTIKGYQAAQNALASVPYPFNLAAAAAIAIKTGANVAGIMSTNVGSFATGGQFMVEGRSGIDNNNINMNVSRGERVTIETPAQQRASDGSGGNGGANINNIKVVNQFDEKEFVAAMDSAEGEEVILNVIKRRKSDTNGILGRG